MKTHVNNPVSQLSSNAKKVMQLLLEGHVDAAKQFIAEGPARNIEKLRAELEDAERERTLLFSMVSLAKGQGSSKPVAESVQMPTNVQLLKKEERKEPILNYAYELARRGNWQITVQSVVDELRMNRIELATDRPNVSVGNILFKSDLWKRVASGVYRYVGPQH